MPVNAQQKAVAESCLEAAHADRMTFPEIVGALADAGFEGYLIDLRRAQATYYLPGGECVELPALHPAEPVAPAFDAATVQAAIREAQTNAPGYSYRGFCSKIAAAGCAGYLVSFLGRRVLYFGRTAEVHTELFPAAQ